jgi:hypothetical protein
MPEPARAVVLTLVPWLCVHRDRNIG